MDKTRVLYPLAVREMARAETRVVLPAPWMPFRAMMKGLEGGWPVGWVERRERINGMQWGDLSSMI